MMPPNQNSTKHMFNRVVDEPFHWLDISSRHPKGIIQSIQDIPAHDRIRLIVLCNKDPWRYGNDPDLLCFFGNDPRKFYILTLGYENRQLLPNVLELSWPSFYLIRPTDSAEPKKFEACKFGFSCLNNTNSFHRLILGWRLWRKNLIKEMIFTQNWHEPIFGYDAVLLDRLDGMSDYIATLPILWQEDNVQDISRDHTISHPAYWDAYCNIATETEAQNFLYDGRVINLPTVTEKTYKPFRSGQVPIWLAAPGHCKYLRSLGFETMEELFSEPYDSMDIFSKTECIADLITKGKDHMADFYHAHAREIQHNRDLIIGRSIEEKIMTNIRQFLNCL